MGWRGKIWYKKRIIVPFLNDYSLCEYADMQILHMFFSPRMRAIKYSFIGEQKERERISFSMFFPEAYSPLRWLLGCYVW